MNPARELVEIFETWDGRTGNADVQRRVSSSEGLSEMVRAAVLLRDIQVTLRAMDLDGHAVSHYWPALDSWRRIAFHVPNGWRNQKTALREMNLLRALAGLIDALASQFELSEPDEIGIRDKLDTVVQDVAADVDLDPLLRRYIAQLAGHLRDVLDDTTINGAFDLAEALKRLSFLFQAAAWQTRESPEKSSRYSAVAEFFRGAYVQGLTGSITAGVIMDPFGFLGG